MGTLILSDLKVSCIAGVPDSERETEQDLYFTLELDFNFEEASVKDDISKTIDYTLIATLVEEHAKRGKYRLIETLSERICTEILFTWTQVIRCKVLVKKITAIPLAKHTVAITEISRKI